VLEGGIQDEPRYPGWGETNFRPRIPTTMNRMHTIRAVSLGSANSRMPRIAVPTAPIPVQTAYAVPIGSVLTEAERNRKLMIILLGVAYAQ